MSTSGVVTTVPLAVGFVDVCGFTRLSRTLDDRQLAALLDRFEAVSARVIGAHGVRLVKLMGDGALFTTADRDTAVAAGLELVERARIDPLLPDVRVGISFGPVLLRHGDCFGTVVNRANRIVEVAPAATVVVDEAARPPGAAAVPLGVIDLRDFDPGPLWAVQPDAADPAPLSVIRASM